MLLDIGIIFAFLASASCYNLELLLLQEMLFSFGVLGRLNVGYNILA